MLGVEVRMWCWMSRQARCSGPVQDVQVLCKVFRSCARCLPSKTHPPLKCCAVPRLTHCSVTSSNVYHLFYFILVFYLHLFIYLFIIIISGVMPPLHQCRPGWLPLLPLWGTVPWLSGTAGMQRGPTASKNPYRRNEKSLAVPTYTR